MTLENKVQKVEVKRKSRNNFGGLRNIATKVATHVILPAILTVFALTGDTKADEQTNLSADFNKDGIVNYEDFAIFAEQWLLEDQTNRIIPVCKCQELTEPGIYALQNDIEAEGDCFINQAENIKLDLGNHIVEGNNTGTGFVNEGYNNVTVQNGHFNQFSNGTHISNAENNKLENLGLNVFGVGIQISNSENVSVNKIKINPDRTQEVDPSLNIGILVSGSPYCELNDIEINSASRSIWLSESPYSNLKNLLLNLYFKDGFLAQSSPNTNVSDSTFSSSPRRLGDDVRLLAGSENTVFSNVHYDGDWEVVDNSSSLIKTRPFETYVRDNFGSPIVNAKVTCETSTGNLESITRTGPNGKTPKNWVTDHTNNRGIIQNYSPYIITVEAEGYSTETLSWDPNESNQENNFTLERLM